MTFLFDVPARYATVHRLAESFKISGSGILVSRPEYSVGAKVKNLASNQLCGVITIYAPMFYTAHA